MTVFYWASGWYYTWILGCLGWGSNRRHPAIYHLKSSVANGNYFLFSLNIILRRSPSHSSRPSPSSFSLTWVYLSSTGTWCWWKTYMFPVSSRTVHTLQSRHISWEFAPGRCRHKSEQRFLFPSHILLLTHRMECNRGLCRWSGCWFSAAEARMWCWVGCGSRKPGWEDMAYEYIL